MERGADLITPANALSTRDELALLVQALVFAQAMNRLMTADAEV